MPENKVINLAEIPKTYCENISVAFSQEHFVLAMMSGDQTDAFALSPQHMKRLAQYFAHQIKGYEKKFGKVEAKWDPSVVSPVQMQDLKEEAEGNE